LRADSGAYEIKELIETPRTVFATASEALGEGLAQSEGLDGDVPASASEAINKLREAYAALKQRIEDIYTNNSSAKDEAMAACATMVIGLEELQTGIIDGYGKPAEKALANATKKMERAATALEKAAGRLA
jgi:DNA repair exonuclease SbcCD ATPase subunit